MTATRRADKAIAGFEVAGDHIDGCAAASQPAEGWGLTHCGARRLVGRNPVLVTALNPVIGYELGAKVRGRQDENTGGGGGPRAGARGR